MVNLSSVLSFWFSRSATQLRLKLDNWTLLVGEISGSHSSSSPKMSVPVTIQQRQSSQPGGFMCPLGNGLPFSTVIAWLERQASQPQESLQVNQVFIFRTGRKALSSTQPDPGNRILQIQADIQNMDQCP